MKIGILAGEASGDILGADLMAGLRQQIPNIEFVGVGGELMREQGLQHSFFPMERLSVMGIWPILKRLPELLKRRRQLIDYLVEQQIECFIGVDAPEFNTGLELKLKQAGIKTVHYVSPSVWAWREKRIEKIKQADDLMLTLLPFELEIYQKHQIPAEFVGHPLAKQIPVLDTEQDLVAKIAAREQLGLPAQSKVIAVLPGSRGSELKHLAPEFARTIALINQSHPDWQFIVPLVNEKRRDQWQQLVAGMPITNTHIVLGQSRRAMRAADSILLASGTATLEAMLTNRPMLVAYKVSALSYQIFKRLLKINSFSLPNLLAGDNLVEEYMQADCRAEQLAPAVINTVEQQHHHQHKFTELHQQLCLDSGTIGAKAVLHLMGIQSQVSHNQHKDTAC